MRSQSSGSQTYAKYPTQTLYKSQYLLNELQQYRSLRCIVKFESLPFRL